MYIEIPLLIMQPITVSGKFGEAIVFADEIEEQAKSQVQNLLDCEQAKDAHVRIMPDVHGGQGCVVGYTAKLTKFVVPNLIGVDIGCGVLAHRLKYRIPAELKEKFFEKVDQNIRKLVPSGFLSHDLPVPLEQVEEQYVQLQKENPKLMPFNAFVEQLNELAKKVRAKPHQQFGTLGGGNHFMEIEESQSGEFYFTVHTGSRNLGLKVAQYHQGMTVDSIFDELLALELIERLERDEVVQVSELHEKELCKALQLHLKESGKIKKYAAMRKRIQSTKPQKGLWFLYGDTVNDYCKDMNIAQIYAQLNRKMIQAAMQPIFDDFGERHECQLVEEQIMPQCIESIHNFIDFSDGIIRKGSISAYEGKPLIIPLNMRDGVVIGYGKSNPEWNCSAPHGAGRKHSRTAALKLSNVQEFQDDMKGVYTTCIGQGTLDEAPRAYKDSEHVLKWIGQTVQIVEVLKSVYNFKAGGDEEQ